jgi:hypothetical protein
MSEYDWEELNQAYEYADNQRYCVWIAQDYLNAKLTKEEAENRIKELSINSLAYFIARVNDD